MDEQTSLPGIDVEARAVPDQSHRQARAVFEQVLGNLPFSDAYKALLADGWEWRKAAYIAWASLPASHRQPETLKEFANSIGLAGGGAIREWRTKNPAIDAMVLKISQQTLNEHAPEVIQALVESAKDPNYKHHPDRRVFLEITGLYTPRQRVALGEDTAAGDEMSDKSSDELRRLAQAGEGESE